MTDPVSVPTSPPRPRPGPARWLWYAVGGGLPERFAPWVLYDTTCRTWWLRHVARVLLQLAPFVAAILLLVPGPLELRTGIVIAGGGLGAFYGIVWLHETTEHRLVKAGYPNGTGPAVRAERARDLAVEQRYNDRYRGGEPVRPRYDVK